MIFAPIPLLLALHAAPTAPSTIRGHCVEARTASVFAGACHYGSEATTAGREALVALRFDAGEHAGVDLSGVVVVLALAGEENLDRPGAPRRSVLYVDGRASAPQRAAARDLLRARFGRVLGNAIAVEAIPIAFRVEGDRYEVDGGDRLSIRGSLLPDRACCSMPFAVWYEPILPLERPIVGRNDSFAFRDDRLAPAWCRRGGNEAFVGAFSWDRGSPARD